MKPKLPEHLFISGIGTGVGKTLVSAVLTECLLVDYWKPIQCGSLDNTDTEIVRSLISNKKSTMFPSAYELKTAASPHFAAKQEQIEIDLKNLKKPEAVRLIIEGAGGLGVPINAETLVVDFIAYIQTPVILVARNYLGSINHTLLSIETLRNRKIELSGIIYSGDNYNDNEEIIARIGNVATLGRITESEHINKEFVKQQARQLRDSLSQYFEL